MMVRHMASQTSMNDSGPDASAPTPFTGAPLGRRGREVISDAAALLHGQRRLAERVEDARHIVRDIAHDKAVKQGDVPVGACAGDNAPGRQELEIVHRVEKPLGPEFCILFRNGQRIAPPGGTCRGWFYPRVSVQDL